MPFTIERLPDLPVILVTYVESITVEDLQTVFIRSLELTRPEDKIIYRIVQAENFESSFANTLQLARTSASSVPGSTSDMRYQLIIVGSDRWSKLYVQMMTQKPFGGRSIPCFARLDQALDYVKARLAARKAANESTTP